MQRTLMKSKIHRATVTDANLHYQGSITLDPELMAAADIVVNERVEIYNVHNGERFATYAIPGTPGKGEVILNGAAAHKASRGHLVIICTYANYDAHEIAGHQPSVVFVNAKNRLAPKPEPVEVCE
jgi:aspartate 1-decarboxylase